MVASVHVSIDDKLTQDFLKNVAPKRINAVISKTLFKMGAVGAGEAAETVRRRTGNLARSMTWASKDPFSYTIKKTTKTIGKTKDSKGKKIIYQQYTPSKAHGSIVDQVVFGTNVKYAPKIDKLDEFMNKGLQKAESEGETFINKEMKKELEK